MMYFSYLLFSALSGLCNCQMGIGGMMAMLNGGGNMAAGNRGIALAGLAGMTGDMAPLDLAFLTNAVKKIVGQHASPDLALIRYASMQNGQPRTMQQFIPYLIFMTNLAKKVGLQMPDGTIQYPSKQMNGITQTGLGNNMKGKKGVLTMQKMKQLITRRAASWLTRTTLMRRSMGGLSR